MTLDYHVINLLVKGLLTSHSATEYDHPQSIKAALQKQLKQKIVGNKDDTARLPAFIKFHE